jgi:hypothetical protein
MMELSMTRLHEGLLVDIQHIDERNRTALYLENGSMYAVTRQQYILGTLEILLISFPCSLS